MKIPNVQKRPDMAFTLTASNLNRLLDKEKYLIIDGYFEMCDNHTLIPWFERNTVLSFWDDDTKRIMVFEFEAYAHSYSTRSYKTMGYALA